MSNLNYIPQKGDVFEWCDEQYLCLEGTDYSGVVHQSGDTFYQRGFIWNYGGEIPKYIRNANAQELETIREYGCW